MNRALLSPILRVNAWLTARRRAERDRGYAFAAGLLLGSRGSVDPEAFTSFWPTSFDEGIGEACRDWRHVEGLRASLQSLVTAAELQTALNPVTFLALFDGADPNATTPSRRATTVPTQALFFLNDPFVHAKSEKCAARLQSARPDEAQLRQHRDRR